MTCQEANAFIEAAAVGDAVPDANPAVIAAYLGEEEIA